MRRIAIFTLLGIFALGAAPVAAGTFSYHVRFDTQWDSVWILIDSAADGSIDDSAKVSSFPYVSSISLDEEVDHRIGYQWWPKGRATAEDSMMYSFENVWGRNRLKPSVYGRTVAVTSNATVAINADSVAGDFDADDFGASSLDDKGNWNTTKTGYALTVAEHEAIRDTVWNQVTDGGVRALTDKVNFGLSTATLGDVRDSVWNDAFANRTLTALDEDNTAIDLDSSDIGYVAHLWNNQDKTGYSLSAGGNTAVRDAVYADVADYRATGFSTHSVANVWAYGTKALTDKAGFALTVAEREAIRDTAWANTSDQRELTHLREANTTFDLDNTTVGGLTDEDGFTLDSAEWENVWQNIDTLNRVDTSDIGDWFVNNVTGGGDDAATIYSYFISGSNEDQFKATGFSTHAPVDNWTYGTRRLTELDKDNTTMDLVGVAIGTADSVRMVGDITTKTGFALTDAQHAAIEDTIHANAADYKADVSGLSTLTDAQVWTYAAGAGRILTAIDDDVTTVTLDDTRVLSADSVRMLATITDKGGYNLADTAMANLEDTIHANAADYKADVSALSTFDASTDSVTLDVSNANAAGGLIDLYRDTLWAMLRDSLVWYTWCNFTVTGAQVDSMALVDTLASLFSSTATVGAATITSIAAAVYDTAVTAPAVFYGPSNTGPGINSVTVYALDTSGTDAVVQNIDVAVKNISGAGIAGPQNTQNDGYVTFTLHSDSAVFVAESTPNYYFSDLRYNVTGTVDSIACLGYDVSQPVPGSANQCNLLGYVYDPSGNADSGVVVQVRRHRTNNPNATVSVAGVMVGPLDVRDTTDADGKFLIPVYETAVYDDTTTGFYDVEGKVGNVRVFYIRELYVPAADNLDITDSLAAR